MLMYQHARASHSQATTGARSSRNLTAGTIESTVFAFLLEAAISTADRPYTAPATVEPVPYTIAIMTILQPSMPFLESLSRAY